MPGGLYWDIIVVRKVDAGLLFGWIVGDTEEFTL